MKKFHLLVVFSGALLAALLIYEIGPGELLGSLRRLGWALVPLILIEGVALLFHTQAWRLCLSDGLRSLPFFRIFSILLAGGSINYLTPFAGLGGEVTKGVLLASGDRASESAAGVIIDKLSYALAQLLFVVAGSLVCFPAMNVSPAVMGAMIGGTSFLGAGILVFLGLQKYGKLGLFLRWLVSRRVGGGPLERLATAVSAVDQKVALFYRRRPYGLPASMVWHLFGMACGILQCYYFLAVLTDQASLKLAAGIWFLGTWFNLLSFALPVNLGVMEAARVISFKIFGLPAALGLTYGIFLRLEQLSWAGVGLLIYAVLLFRMRRGAASRLREESYELLPATTLDQGGTNENVFSEPLYRREKSE